MDTQKIRRILKEECPHHDKDNRIMGARDLAAELIKAHEAKHQVDSGLEKQICDAFIQGLSDNAADMRTECVRSIQISASILSEKNLETIVEALADQVVDRPLPELQADCLLIKELVGRLPH